MTRSTFIYYKGNMYIILFRCEIFCTRWNLQIGQTQKQAYWICTHNFCCRPLLLYFYESFVSSFPSFLPPFSSLPSFSSSSPRSPNNFLAFHFFPCPNPGKRRERAARISLLSQLIFILDPLLHRLNPVNELGCCPIMLSHKAPEGFLCPH